MALGTAALLTGSQAIAEDGSSLINLDLQDLMKVELVSSSKFKQELSEVAAAAFVISEEDIKNSGAGSLPELLQMVPGLYVAESSANSWAMGIRGFNSVFSNKMLVMIDGRSLFSPLFSGVFWEQLDLYLPDIERIEVIRGVGSTVWGANAVDGIINIITKSTLDNENTQFYVKSGTSLKYDTGVRFGTQVGKQSYARFYAKSKDIKSSPYSIDGIDDRWSSNAVGGKWEMFAGSDSLMVSTDWIEQSTNETALSTSRIGRNEVPLDNQNRNISFQWQRQVSTDRAFTLASQWQQTTRDSSYYRIDDHMVNVEFDSSIGWEENQLLFGVGARRHNIDFQPRVAFVLDGSDGMTATQASIYSAYVQDEWHLAEGHHLLLGSKFEAHRHVHGDGEFVYEQNVWLPTLRYRLDISPQSRFWMALSKSARIPSISEHMVQFPVFTFDAFSQNDPTPWPFELLSTGNRRFKKERVRSLELGLRSNVNGTNRVDLVLFYNRFKDIRSFILRDPMCASTGLPVPMCAPNDTIIQLNTFENHGQMKAFGLEANWQSRLSNDLSLSTSYSFMHQILSATDSNVFEEAMYITPRHQLALQLDWRLGEHSELHLLEKYVSGIDDSKAPTLQSIPDFMDHYHKLDVNYVYRLDENIKFHLRVDNLLDEDGTQWAPEFPAAHASRSERRVSFGVDFKY